MIRHPSILTEPGEKWKKHRKVSLSMLVISVAVSLLTSFAHNVGIQPSIPPFYACQYFWPASAELVCRN
jgi:hypothetical protein